MSVLLVTVSNNAAARSDEQTGERQQALEKIHTACRQGKARAKSLQGTSVKETRIQRSKTAKEQRDEKQEGSKDGSDQSKSKK